MWLWNKIPLTHFGASSHVYHLCIREWNSLTDTLLSATEGAEDSVAKFTSLVRARD